MAKCETTGCKKVPKKGAKYCEKCGEARAVEELAERETGGPRKAKAAPKRKATRAAPEPVHEEEHDREDDEGAGERAAEGGSAPTAAKAVSRRMVSASEMIKALRRVGRTLKRFQWDKRLPGAQETVGNIVLRADMLAEKIEGLPSQKGTRTLAVGAIVRLRNEKRRVKFGVMGFGLEVVSVTDGLATLRKNGIPSMALVTELELDSEAAK